MDVNIYIYVAIKGYSHSLRIVAQSPGEVKSREVELGSHNWMVCLAAELFHVGNVARTANF